MSTELRPLDPRDESQVRAYWEVGRDAVAERPYHTFLPWEAARVHWREAPPDAVEQRLVAWDGDLAVGTAVVGASTVDNPHLAFAHVAVRPDRRRAGTGSALLAAAEAWATEHGCTTVTSEVYAPVDHDSAGLVLARRRGYHVDLEDGVKVADLQRTRETWPALAAEAAVHHRSYRLVTSWSPLPDALVTGYCEVSNRFYELAPAGGVERDAETLDAARLRVREERAARAGRHEVITLALDADGRAVAMTELMVNAAAAHRAQQGGTVVLPGHRGHRLGLATKVANQAALLERFPDVEWILTANADVNAAMNAVNERLGFRVVERCVEVAKALA